MNLRAVVVGLLLASTVVAAERTAIIKVDESNFIRLYNAPCMEKKVLDLVQDQFHGRFLHAQLSYRGQGMLACWMEEGGVVFVLTGDKEVMSFPMNAFRLEELN
jgi:hypothetical protein